MSEELDDLDERATRRLLGSGQLARDHARDRAFAAVAAALDLDVPSAPRPVHTLGRFIVLDELGSGANGRVYAAYDPQLDRKVALKTLRSLGGVGEHERKLRLQREARALARLRHPNVVAVHDVGTHEGELYLAMELVEGQTLTRWREAETRAWTAIVEVFTQAGRGLAAAHEAGIIHRDFKPDNVLIDGHGAARVVDFGLAGRLPPTLTSEAALDGDQDHVEVTRTGAVVGTPAYLAPECFGGEASSEASDQFSFCVALFEALYGQRPFAGDTVVNLAANVRAGRIRPADRGAVPSWLHRVVTRGLASEPGQRHANMDALLAACERGSGSAQRWRAAAAAAGLAMLVAGLVATNQTPSCPIPEPRLEAVWSPARAEQARASFAATELGFAAQTAERAVAALDEWAESWRGAWSETCAAAPELRDRQRACLDRSLDQVEGLVDRWLVADAETLVAAVEAAHAIHSPADCLGPLWTNPALSHASLDADRLETIEALRSRQAAAALSRHEGHYDEATAELRASLVEAEALAYAPLEAELLVELGNTLRMNLDVQAAEGVLERAFFVAQRAGYDLVAIEAALELARLVIQGRGSLDRGELWLEHATVLLERWPEHPAKLAELAEVRAGVRARAGDFAGAIALYDEAIALDIELVGEDHWTIGMLWHQRSALELKQGDAARADADIARAIEILEHSLGPTHPKTANAVRARVAVKLGLDDTEAALTLSLNSIERLEQAFGPVHAEVASGYLNHAVALYQHGDRELALDYFHRSLDTYTAELGPDHPNVTSAIHNIGTALEGMNRREEAVTWHERGLEQTRAALGPDHRGVLQSEVKLAGALFNIGQSAAARTHIERARTIAEASGAGTAETVHVLGILASTTTELGDFEAAHAALEDARALAQAHTEGGRDAMLRAIAIGLADLALAEHEWSTALDHAHAALALSPAAHVPFAELRVGMALVELGEADEARANLERALEVFESAGQDPMAIGEARWALARAHHASGLEPAAALTLAQAAAEDYASVGRREHAARVRAWLAIQNPEQEKSKKD